MGKSGLSGSGEGHRDEEGEFSVLPPVSEIAVHGFHEIFGNIEADTGVIFGGFFRIIGVKDVLFFADAFSVVGDGEIADAFFPGRRNPEVTAFGMFDGIEDDVADHRIQTVVLGIDGYFAGNGFEKDAVSGAVGFKILFCAFQQFVQIKNPGIFRGKVIFGIGSEIVEIFCQFCSFMTEDIHGFAQFGIGFPLSEDTEEIFHAEDGFFHIVRNIAQQLIAFFDHGFHFPGLNLHFRLQIFGEMLQLGFLAYEYGDAQISGIKHDHRAHPERRMGHGEHSDVRQAGEKTHNGNQQGIDEVNELQAVSFGRKGGGYEQYQREQQDRGENVSAFPGRKIKRQKPQHEDGEGVERQQHGDGKPGAEMFFGAHDMQCGELNKSQRKDPQGFEEIGERSGAGEEIGSDQDAEDAEDNAQMRQEKQASFEEAHEDEHRRDQRGQNA